MVDLDGGSTVKGESSPLTPSGLAEALGSDSIGETVEWLSTLAGCQAPR